MGENQAVRKVSRRRDGRLWRIRGMRQRESLRGDSYKNRHLLGYCCAWVLALSQSACTMPWLDLAVTVIVPDFPPVWAAADSWELDWLSLKTGGEPRRAHPGDILVLRLPRTELAALRCRPVFGSYRGLPYGAIWPSSAHTGGAWALAADSRLVLCPDAKGGLEAELAFRLYQGGWDAANFNLERFSVEAVNRMADPWDCDFTILAKAVAVGGFRADYLSNPDKVQFMVYGLPTEMASDSPWGLPIRPGPLRSALVSAAPGIHRWFGGAYELVVSVSDRGSVDWLLRGSAGNLIQNVLP